ncbi:MAG: MFS transporter, partial [Olsenella sp.]
MKLDVKRTVLIGFAFFSICAFWQLYNSVIPLMLTNTFHMNETISGVIMAADNVLALFLLPIFGTISDRCRHPWGKRMPFIVFGTIAAVLLMVVLPMIDDSYAAGADSWKIAAFVAVLLALLGAMGTYRSPAVALMPDLTPKPLRSRGNAIINLMGAVGGILYLGIAAVLYSKSRTSGL